MDDICLMIIFIWLIFAVLILLLIFLERRPKLLCTIQNRDVLSYRQEIIKKLTDQGYIVEKKRNNKVFVQKDTFSATILIFKQNKSNVDVLFIPSNSLPLLIAIIASLFTIWIIAIVLAAIADGKSKKFRDNELLPILTGYGKIGRICPNCGRPIPWDAVICPYCGKQFEKAYK